MPHNAAVVWFPDEHVERQQCDVLSVVMMVWRRFNGSIAGTMGKVDAQSVPVVVHNPDIMLGTGGWNLMYR